MLNGKLELLSDWKSTSLLMKKFLYTFETVPSGLVLVDELVGWCCCGVSFILSVKDFSTWSKDNISSGILCFLDNICSSNFEVSSNIFVHPPGLHYKIVLKVLSSCFFENCSFFLCMLSVSLKHFRTLAVVLIFIMELYFCLIPIPMLKQCHIIMWSLWNWIE